MNPEFLAAFAAAGVDDKGGNPTSHFPFAGTTLPKDRESGYWAGRSNDRIYLMTLLFSSIYCKERENVADVGCNSSPLVLQLPDFKKRFAFDPDPEVADLWKDVDGALFINSLLSVETPRKLVGAWRFDLILCNQVIEHLEEPEAFAELLCATSKRLIISTTFETPECYVDEHVQDPISLEKFENWFPRKMLQCFISRGPNIHKILAVF